MTATMPVSMFRFIRPGSTTFDYEWRSRCHVAEVSRRTVDWMIRDAHYLRCWPGVVVCSLGMFLDMEPIGVCVFSLPPRETEQRYGGVTWELARLWIEDDVPRNAETWLIGKSVRHVRACHRDVRMLVSYADPSQGHTGTIYRAANWLFDGMTNGLRERYDYRWNGKVYQRASHIPDGAVAERVLRTGKFRFTMTLAERKAA